MDMHDEHEEVMGEVKQTSNLVIDDDAKVDIIGILGAAIDVGVSDALRWPLIAINVLIVAAVLEMALAWTPWSKDATDQNQGWGPGWSGFTVRTDDETGCQYLTIGGAIHPRIDVHGRHMGCAR